MFDVCVFDNLVIGQKANQQNNHANNLESIKKANMKKPEHEAAQKTKDNMMIENENNKAYIEYVVEAAPYKEPNAESKHAPKKPKVLFKADKNLQRVEKKSWKIPIKILTLPNEQRHSNQQMMEQLSEAIDG